MSVAFTDLTIGGADRKANAIRAELWRDVNAVGRWLAILDNTGGTFNGIFDVQDQFLIAVDGNPLMQGRVDSSPSVTLAGIDAEDIFGEKTVIRGVDQMQDFLFHNDLDNFYPDTTQQIKAVLNDLINVGTISTNITYALPAPATPAVGAIEFREGTSFLSTLQEMFRSVDWLFFVDDVLALQSGAPGFSATGAVVTSQLNNAANNVLGQVEYIERDGGKLYNRIKLFGKNPQFDAWTEQNAASWTTIFGGNNPVDDTTTVRVGTYSQVVSNNNPVNVALVHAISLPQFNYTSFDLSKGKIGAWCRYDNDAGAPGAPGAGAAPGNLRVELKLIDLNGRFVQFFGPQLAVAYTKRSGGSRIYEDEWGWCEWNMGEETQGAVAALADAWFQGGPAGVFDWTQVTDVEFWLPRASLPGNQPSHFYLDGLTFPLPPIARAPDPVLEPTVSQNAYRVRPLILNMPNIRTQNALQAKADSILGQHAGSEINFVKFTIIGNPNFRYGGQSFDIFIPDLGIDDGAGGALVFYATSIHHIIEPKVDVSGGFGYDWITEVEGVSTTGIAFDHARLGPRALFSSYQVGMNAGTGIRVK